MNDADREELEVSAIAALTAAEVRVGLRQFGLQPLKRLPPELKRLRADAKYRTGVLNKIVEGSAGMRAGATATPGTNEARDKASGGALWMWMRWQLQWLKSALEVGVFRVALGASVAMLCVTVVFVHNVRSAASRPDPPVASQELTDLAFRKIHFVNFSVSEELRIREALKPLLNPRCTTAFASAGLRSPAEVLTNEGVVIMPSSALYYSTAEELGLVDEVTWTTYRVEFSSGQAQAGMIPPTLYGIKMTTDGRPRIFLNDSAFKGESFIYRRLSLHDVLAHEFIHVGGQPPTTKSIFQHDLSGFEHYDEIMDACRF